jgi:serine acetyltransferase
MSSALLKRRLLGAGRHSSALLGACRRSTLSRGLSNSTATDEVDYRERASQTAGDGWWRKIQSTSAVDPSELCPYALARGIRSKGIERAVWSEIRDEAKEQSKEQSWRTLDLQEFGMDDFLSREVLDHRSLACGLAAAVGGKLSANGRIGGSGIDYEKIFLSAFRAEPTLCTSVASDMLRFKEVDPACPGLLAVYLFYKGVHAMACARVSGYYWRRRGEAGKLIARLLQSEGSDMYGVDIHPGARLGNGITIDHATGVVIGETSVIGDNVYLMHDVTLGATGTSDEHDRHPKIGAGVAPTASHHCCPNPPPAGPTSAPPAPLTPRAWHLVLAHSSWLTGSLLQEHSSVPSAPCSATSRSARARQLQRKRSSTSQCRRATRQSACPRSCSRHLKRASTGSRLRHHSRVESA